MSGFPGAMPRVVLVWACLAACGAGAAWADELETAQELFRTGKYDECAQSAAQQLQRGARSEAWYLLKVKAELARGKYTAAMVTVDDGISRMPSSLPLRLISREVYRYNGRGEEAEAMLTAIERFVQSVPQWYANPAGRVTVGRFLLSRGTDARKVLDQLYDVARKEDPDFVETYIATAELALEKQDDALAAETLEKAPDDARQDPRYHYLLACAFSDEDRKKSDEALNQALKINPKHVDSLLLQADHLIDAEQYAEAAKRLKQVFEVNPLEARAFAYQAILAHLQNNPKAEAEAHRSALARWASNPEVDHLIGRKISQKYRFAEGANYQRQALKIDADYLPAKIQLAQDLLRLGDEAEGWKLADATFARDAYNVVAFNLVTLHDHLKDYRTLEADGLLVRMVAREAELYGDRVLKLLSQAKKTLGETYGVKVPEPVIVEIFAQKKDFAVRTFALPGAEGFLGVCFGKVITANSPASQGDHAANWESVLWHEFCHVVTLTKTKNKMPRWLSEGISVYEEGKRDPAWADALNPKYRTMLLGEDFTPLSKLSSAFMAPKTGLHLQFAYFESALAIEFLVATAGLPALQGVLDDLGAGLAINEALPKRTKMTLEQLDNRFAQFARKKAESVATGLTWEEPDLPADTDSKSLAVWLEQHPRSFWGQKRLASQLLAEGKTAEARTLLEKLKSAYPEYVGADNAYLLLAAIDRKQGDRAGERAMLEELVARDGSASPAYLRLMELDEAAADWSSLAKHANLMLAVNPLVPAPHRAMASAAEHLGKNDQAISAYRALLMLDETDPADQHFRLAKALRQANKLPEAKREVLKALEEAPRFREAHQLLLDVVGHDQPKETER